MVPLQKIIADIQGMSPYLLLVLLYVGVASIRRRRKHPPEPGVKGLLKETGDVIVIILCIWTVQLVIHWTVGDDKRVAGIGLHELLDIGHLAAVFNWVMGTLLRLWP